MHNFQGKSEEDESGVSLLELGRITWCKDADAFCDPVLLSVICPFLFLLIFQVAVGYFTGHILHLSLLSLKFPIIGTKAYVEPIETSQIFASFYRTGKLPMLPTKLEKL